jgi:integrase
MAIHRLTPAALNRTKVGRFSDGGGLVLQISKAKGGGVNRSWIFRYAVPDPKKTAGYRNREMGLGSCSTIGLAKARELARQCREQRLAGIDPLIERQKQRQALIAEQAKRVTFRERADQYLTLHEKGWSREHAAQFASSVKFYVLPKLGDLAPAAITPAMVLNVVQPLWSTRTVTMQRVLNRIERVLDYCATCGDREGDNPARNVAHALPKASTVAAVERHPALPYDQIPTLVSDLSELKTLGSSALRFLILTASRANEVLRATWTEIDFAERKWTRPVEHMKGRDEHVVPLSRAALEILRELAEKPHDGEDCIFGGRRGGGDHAMMRALRKFKGKTETNIHGLRSTFRQWAAERTNFPDHIAELALAHKVGGEIERVYKRKAELFERRRRLMVQWATFCTTPAAAIVSATVTPFARAADARS